MERYEVARVSETVSLLDDRTFRAFLYNVATSAWAWIKPYLVYEQLWRVIRSMIALSVLEHHDTNATPWRPVANGVVPGQRLGPPVVQIEVEQPISRAELDTHASALRRHLRLNHDACIP